MFGNRLGWIISGVIVLAFAGLMFLFAQLQEPSDPTPFTSDAKNMAALQLPVAPETVVPTMTAAGDAAEKYREAIDDVEAHPTDYKLYKKDKTRALKGVLAIVEAGPIKEMHLFSKKPNEVMNYTADKDAITDLVHAGEMTGTTAQALFLAGEYAEGMKFAEADFALGVKLYNERITYEELVAGLGEMDRGATVIRSIAAKTRDATRAAQCDTFLTEYKAYDAKYIKPIHQFTAMTQDPRIFAGRAGDLFALARDSKERMWRTEAILQLGRMRFNIGDGRSADQNYAMRLLRKIAQDDKDEVVRAAAVMARDLDSPTYQLQSAHSHAVE